MGENLYQRIPYLYSADSIGRLLNRNSIACIETHLPFLASEKVSLADACRDRPPIQTHKGSYQAHRDNVSEEGVWFSWPPDQHAGSTI
jgi:hypothetical protein